MKNKKGQVLVGVIALLVVLAILIPAMVKYIQHETQFSEKLRQNNNAFQLAESGVDRAYRKIVESTATWGAIQLGQAIPGYSFDTPYKDLAGGAYTISITSGPQLQQATVVVVGRDKRNKETRALKVVYTNAILGSTALRAQGKVSLSGSNMQIEWGGVTSPSPITPNATYPNHPQLRSASYITGKDTNPLPLNTDSRQWWSYSQDIPPTPALDLDFYRATAAATSTIYYSTTVANFLALCDDDHTCNTGKTYFINGNLNISGSIYVGGNLIVTGDMTLPSGMAGQGTPTVYMPRTAWKQYLNDWDYYLSNPNNKTCGNKWTDTTAARPGTAPSLNSSYLSDVTPVTIDKTVVNGFTYVGGNFKDGGGGGGSIFAGSIYVVGSATMSSNNNCLFYTEEGASRMVTTNVYLVRESWQDSKQSWPAALP